MSFLSLPFLIFLVGILLAIAWLAGQPLYVAYQRRRIRNRSFPPAWRRILRQHVPYFRRLPPDLQLQLKKHIQVFLAEKKFVGCSGLVITEEMQVTIAAQACLLILNRKTDYYPNLKEILVYPSAFFVNNVQTDSTGVLHEQRELRAGQSWSRGQVILSWQDTLEGAAIVNDGRNVVIHEFAHQLDQETGIANGAPSLGSSDRYFHWSTVLSREFSELQERAQKQLPSLLNHYGATNPAEFFAVASEVFFEQPDQLAAEALALYEELRNFYCVHPIVW